MATLTPPDIGQCRKQILILACHICTARRRLPRLFSIAGDWMHTRKRGARAQQGHLPTTLSSADNHHLPTQQYVKDVLKCRGPQFHAEGEGVENAISSKEREYRFSSRYEFFSYVARLLESSEIDDRIERLRAGERRFFQRMSTNIAHRAGFAFQIHPVASQIHLVNGVTRK